MKYIAEYKVLAGQIDITNHLSNVQYYEFFKSATFSFLEEYKFSDLNKPKNVWPVAFSEGCKFFREVLFNDVVTIEIYFSDVNERKHKYHCHGLMLNQAGEQLASWESFVGIMNRDTRKIEPMSDAAYEIFKKFNGEQPD